MDEAIPLARLSKDQQRVICARIKCGESFAERWTDPPRVMFGSGWIKRGDTWIMSQRARRRMSEGRPPVFRRDPGFDVLGWKDGPWDHVANRQSPRNRGDRPDRFMVEAELPTFVTCPACELRQFAEPEALRCERAPG
jgi:hypothetical protein